MCSTLISVIIPVRNEQRHISDLITSILSQDYPENKYEIIICDGLSEDKTIQIIERFQKKYNNIKIIQNNNKIIPIGFNKGLNESIGEIIIRVDGHSQLSPDYFKRSIQLLENIDNDIVGGGIETISYGSIGSAISIAQSSYFGVGNVRFRSQHHSDPFYVNTLAFGAHRRELFTEIGGYAEEMICNQDDEFNYRAIQAGKKILMDPSIKTKYFSRSNFSKLFKQYFNYGYFKVRVLQKRRMIFSIRHFIPSIFIISIISSLIIGNIMQQPLVSYGVLLLYMIVNVISSIYFSTKILLIPLIFISFWVLHFSYGLGFLYGLFRFIFKWSDIGIKDRHFNQKKFITNNRTILN